MIEFLVGKTWISYFEPSSMLEELGLKAEIYSAAQEIAEIYPKVLERVNFSNQLLGLTKLVDPFEAAKRLAIEVLLEEKLVRANLTGGRLACSILNAQNLPKSYSIDVGSLSEVRPGHPQYNALIAAECIRSGYYGRLEGNFILVYKDGEVHKTNTNSLCTCGERHCSHRIFGEVYLRNFNKYPFLTFVETVN